MTISYYPSACFCDLIYVLSIKMEGQILWRDLSEEAQSEVK